MIILKPDYLIVIKNKDLHCPGFGPSSYSEELYQTFKNFYLL